MRDIVERLREMGKGFKGYPSGCTETLLIREAADEIERLRVVVDAARDFVNNHMDHDDAMRIFDALAALEDDNE